MARYAAVPVGTRVLRSNGLWQEKGEDGRWRWLPREKPRRRAGRVVAFEVTAEEWERLQERAFEAGLRSVAQLARWTVLGVVHDREESATR